MRIGLLGYGKMGQAIENIALERGHEIAWKINIDNRDALTRELLCSANVVIEFSQPAAAFHNVMDCLKAGVPVVSGTTGWLEQLSAARKWAGEHNGALLWSSNFSVGVNLFFALNRQLAAIMNARPEYDPSVSETHHIHKIDAPSGTALTLTHDILNTLDRKQGWVLHPAPASETDITVTAFREDEVPGTHSIRWTSDIDEITLEHRAFSRTGFATGAVIAAEWLMGRTGVFSMADVLGL